jgi:hypothetical protein
MTTDQDQLVPAHIRADLRLCRRNADTRTSLIWKGNIIVNSPQEAKKTRRSTTDLPLIHRLPKSPQSALAGALRRFDAADVLPGTQNCRNCVIRWMVRL